MEHGCVLGKESERLVVRKNGAVLQEVPAIKVDQILVFGNSQITTQAMAFCLLERIPIVLLSGRGRYYGVIDSLDADPVLLQRDQFQRCPWRPPMPVAPWSCPCPMRRMRFRRLPRWPGRRT